MSMFDPNDEPSAEAIDRGAEMRAEVDEMAQRHPSPHPGEWADHYGFGDEDRIFGKGM